MDGIRADLACSIAGGLQAPWSLLQSTAAHPAIMFHPSIQGRQLSSRLANDKEEGPLALDD